MTLLQELKRMMVVGEFVVCMMPSGQVVCRRVKRVASNHVVFEKSVADGGESRLDWPKSSELGRSIMEICDGRGVEITDGLLSLTYWPISYKVFADWIESIHLSNYLIREQDAPISHEGIARNNQLLRALQDGHPEFYKRYQREKEEAGI